MTRWLTPDDLRSQVQAIGPRVAGRLKVSEQVGDAKALHGDVANAGALFQVASQFNWLEMVSPGLTPEQGITILDVKIGSFRHSNPAIQNLLR